jgi:hypothetical protein
MDGSPSGERYFVIWNPPYLSSEVDLLENKGEETDIDHYDSDMIDVRIDKNSFTEI